MELKNECKKGDIICSDQTDRKTQRFVVRITDERDIIVCDLFGGPEHKWEGPYFKISSIQGEKTYVL